jgi:hypothetical protein
MNKKSDKQVMKEVKQRKIMEEAIYDRNRVAVELSLY